MAPQPGGSPGAAMSRGWEPRREPRLRTSRRSVPFSRAAIGPAGVRDHPRYPPNRARRRRRWYQQPGTAVAIEHINGRRMRHLVRMGLACRRDRIGEAIASCQSGELIHTAPQADDLRSKLGDALPEHRQSVAIGINRNKQHADIIHRGPEPVQNGSDILSRQRRDVGTSCSRDTAQRAYRGNPPP